MTTRRWMRLGAKALHDLASIGFGGGLAACLVINLAANRASPAEFAAARHLFDAIARWVLLPSMAVVVASGLLAMLATRGYLDAGWAWVKALLGLSVAEATFLITGSGQRQVDLADAGRAAQLDAVLRSERNTLWFLLVLSAVNVVLAVWRPRLTIRIR